MDGIVLINKPIGITSYDVIRVAKKIFKTSKIGHTGTLDPFAEGLVILCIGRATKLVNRLIDANKTYEGTIIFNNHYDTYDTTGEIIKSDSKEVKIEQLRAVASEFIGSYLQMPPIYSAIKKDGKKLYEYARNNIEVEVEPRLVHIYDLTILNKLNYNEYSFRASVSKGTYIRSLAVDIASKLNTFGALNTLKRTKIGKYLLSDAINLDQLSINDIISIEDIFKDKQSIVLNDYMIRLVKNGIYLDERQIITNNDFKVYNENNELVAIYEVVSENKYRPFIIL